jgi:hypothetical protein
MTPAAHVSAGLLVFAACPGPWPVKLAVAVASHVVVDGLAGWHPTETTPGVIDSTVWNGDTPEKRAMIAANVLGLGVATWYAWLHPWALVYVVAAGLFDLDWVVRAIWPKLRWWSPHTHIVDPIANWLWGSRRDHEIGFWLEVVACLSGALAFWL